MNEPLLSTNQTARRLGISFWTLGRWARMGLIPSVKLGRRRLFESADIEEFIRMRKNASAKEKGSEDAG